MMRFLGSRTIQWTQILYEGTIFDVEHDDRKRFQIFENFGKSWNKFFQKCNFYITLISESDQSRVNSPFSRISVVQGDSRISHEILIE